MNVTSKPFGVLYAYTRKERAFFFFKYILVTRF